MSAPQIARFRATAVVTTCAMLNAAVSIPSTASADPCPDIEVVWAHASGEATGVGGGGQAFVDSLRSQVPGRSVGVYPVNYPETDVNGKNDIVSAVFAGAADVRAHVESMVENCPNTRMVLAGYSLGASVIDLATDSMPPQVADHVAAVALFGNPNSQSPYAQSLWTGQLPIVGPLYRPKTIDLCLAGDPVCSDGKDPAAHTQYVQSGMTNQAAAFAASRI